jgi:FimV-like protein
MSRSILVIALFSMSFASGTQAAGNNSRSLEDILRSITARQVYKTNDDPGAIVDAVAAERSRSEKAVRAPNPASASSPARTRGLETHPDDIAAVVDAVARERAGADSVAETVARVGASPAPTAVAGTQHGPSSYDAGIRDVVSILNPEKRPAQPKHQPIVDLDGESVAPLNTRQAPKRVATFAAVIPERAKPQPGVYTYGPTRGGITLTEVATNLLPSKDVTVAQMMWALYQKNKQAFTNEDITRLKPKSTLNVPHLDEVQAVSRAAAEEALARLRTPPNRTASAKLSTAL